MLTAQEIPSHTTPGDAREAFTYWRSRHSQLRWHRRSARREARTMTARWRARLVRAHLERLGLESVGIVVEPLVSALGRTRGDHARWLWRTFGRRTPLASRKLWLAVAVAAAATCALGVLALHAAWVLLF